MNDTSKNNQVILVPNRILKCSSQDYNVSLIISVPSVTSNPTNEQGWVDEIIYVDDLNKARQKQEELRKRKTSDKRRIIVVSAIQEIRNFSEFK